MSKRFRIWCRRNSFADWHLYGTFDSEAEYRRELPNIEAQGLYTKRVVWNYGWVDPETNKP